MQYALIFKGPQIAVHRVRLRRGDGEKNKGYEDGAANHFTLHRVFMIIPLPRPPLN
ncbi:MAG: hypothetical protein M5R36_19015 [Deltaproteobacteria bacterium]|nr:hypothetical protein [Deltaproteobacteria bacterium]